MIMRDSNGSQSFTGTSTNIEMDGFDGVNSPSIASNSYYGQSLAVGNGKIVVGAPYDDEAGLNGAGSIWISDDVTDPRSSQQRIVKSTAQANCYFGFSVAVGDNKIAAGAPFEDHSSRSDAGAVYLYDLDGTNEVRIQKPTSATNVIDNSDRFGYSLAIGGDKLYVGCPRDRGSTTGGSVRGAVYVFNVDTGDFIQEINASDEANSDYFGWDVAVGNNKLVVGSPYDDDNSQSGSGSVYVYNLDGTGEVKITDSSAYANANFGRRVAVGEGKILSWFSIC